MPSFFSAMITLALFLCSTTAHKSSTIGRRASKDSGKGSWVRHGLIGQGPRQEHSIANIGEDIYVLGGVAYNEESVLETLNRVEFYNVGEKKWDIAAPLPAPMNHGNTAAVDGKLYVLGYLSGGKNWKAMGNTYVYQPYNDTWTNIQPMPNGTARGSSAIGVYNGKVYLAGGMTILQPYPGGHQDSLSVVSSYDTSRDSWNIDYPPLPQPRQHVGGAVVGSTFYVIGGRENGIEQYHNTTYALDLEDPAAWVEKAPMPTARGSIACSPIGFEIYCFGGEGNPDNPYFIFNETQVYDTKKDVWTTLQPMEVPRHGTGAVAIGNAIYIPGGGVTTAAYPSGIFDAFVPGTDRE